MASCRNPPLPSTIYVSFPFKSLSFLYPSGKVWQVAVIMPPKPIYTQNKGVLLLLPTFSHFLHPHKYPNPAMVISSSVRDSCSLMLTPGNYICCSSSLSAKIGLECCEILPRACGLELTHINRFYDWNDHTAKIPINKKRMKNPKTFMNSVSLLAFSYSGSQGLRVYSTMHWIEDTNTLRTGRLSSVTGNTNTLRVTPMGNSFPPIQPTCMSLDCLWNQDHSEETRVNMWRI